MRPRPHQYRPPLRHHGGDNKVSAGFHLMLEEVLENGGFMDQPRGASLPDRASQSRRVRTPVKPMRPGKYAVLWYWRARRGRID